MLAWKGHYNNTMDLVFHYLFNKLNTLNSNFIIDFEDISACWIVVTKSSIISLISANFLQILIKYL